jgi:3',5'-cyclic AMP phosphodiesterase CpdA
MPLILHLSDLHLVPRSESRVLDDHSKQAVVPVEQRETLHDIIEHTFRRLRERLKKENRKLDAIIMSGDIANHNRPEGYSLFLELLKELDEVCPEPEFIVVVPGNHDVDAGREPGDPKRYELFADQMRTARFVTPLLEGVDKETPKTNEELRLHMVRFRGLEIVPINTSDFAQVRIRTRFSEPQWEAMQAALGADKDALEALDKLRTVDAARVSPQQMDSIRSMLQTASRFRTEENVSRPPEFPTPLRIGVLHHQLLPVSDIEEVKGFESFTNLGRLRQFLVDNDIAIVLHGHKHEAVTYTDYIPNYQDPSQPPRQVLVIAGPSPSQWAFDRHYVCQLIEIEPDQPEVKIEEIPAAYPGRTFLPGARMLLPYMRPGAATGVRTGGILMVDGPSVATVYRQLLANVQAAGGRATNVVSRIERTPKDEEVSDLYPGFRVLQGPLETPNGETGPEERLRRFRELVRWWQHPALVSPVDEPAFTHGTRILRYDGHLDQLAEVAAVLRSDIGSTRGMVVLLNPSADKISDLDNEFPSFCHAQFLVRIDRGVSWLDCVAYFRKQEIKHWWLVNIAEITDLQRRLVKLLTAGGKKGARVRSIQAGSITTIAAVAHAGISPPKVQVPKIDQYYTVEREKLCAMVTALLWQEMPGRAAYAKQWREVLTSLIPGEKRDPDGVAVAFEGLRFLLNELRRHLAEAAHQHNPELKELALLLERLLHENTFYLNDDNRNRVDQERHNEWRVAVEPLVGAMLKLTCDRISSVAVTATLGSGGGIQPPPGSAPSLLPPSS